MPQNTERFAVDLLPTLDEIPRLAAEIESFLSQRGVDDRTIMQVNLVLEELITNVISYGTPNGRALNIRLEMHVDATAIEFALLDNGLPFNPLDKPDPDLGADLAGRRVGGLGVYLARQLTDAQTYERREDSVNVLRLIKRLH